MPSGRPEPTDFDGSSTFSESGPGRLRSARPGPGSSHLGRRSPLILLLSCLLLAVLIPASAAPPGPTLTRPFDAEASRASFHVRTLWLSAIEGYFDHVSGFLRLLPDGEAEVFAWVDMHRMHTGSERYAKILASDDFFAIASYPKMRFRSARFDRKLLRTGGSVGGWLTLRDSTRYIRLELKPGDCSGQTGESCVLLLAGVIDRSEFGIRAYGLVVSQNVRLKLRVVLAEAGRRS